MKKIAFLVASILFLSIPLRAGEASGVTRCEGTTNGVKWKVAYFAGMPETSGCIMFVWEGGHWEQASGWCNCSLACQTASGGSGTGFRIRFPEVKRPEE